MNISQVQPNLQDPKKKTPITGTISQILGQSQTPNGIQFQNVLCDGAAATFWCGKKPLTQQDLNNPTEMMCKAQLYQGAVQYHLSRVYKGGGSYGNRNWDKELENRNRGIALSYVLSKEYLAQVLDVNAYKMALEIAGFMSTGQIPQANNPNYEAGYQTQIDDIQPPPEEFPDNPEY